MGHRPPSTIASIDGRVGASGTDCSRRWQLATRSQRARRSTPLTSKPSAPRSEEKGGRAQAISPLPGGQTTKIHGTHRRRRATLCRHAHAGQRRRRKRPLRRFSSAPSGAKHILADKGYDADALRRTIRGAGAVPVIPDRRTQTTPHPLRSRTRYKERHLVENAFCRLKDFRRVATRYDKLTANFLSAVAIATLVVYWL